VGSWKSAAKYQKNMGRGEFFVQAGFVGQIWFNGGNASNLDGATFSPASNRNFGFVGLGDPPRACGIDHGRRGRAPASRDRAISRLAGASPPDIRGIWNKSIQRERRAPAETPASFLFRLVPGKSDRTSVRTRPVRPATVRASAIAYFQERDQRRTVALRFAPMRPSASMARGAVPDGEPGGVHQVIDGINSLRTNLPERLGGLGADVRVGLSCRAAISAGVALAARLPALLKPSAHSAHLLVLVVEQLGQLGDAQPPGAQDAHRPSRRKRAIQMPASGETGGPPACPVIRLHAVQLPAEQLKHVPHIDESQEIVRAAREPVDAAAIPAARQRRIKASEPGAKPNRADRAAAGSPDCLPYRPAQRRHHCDQKNIDGQMHVSGRLSCSCV